MATTTYDPVRGAARIERAANNLRFAARANVPKAELQPAARCIVSELNAASDAGKFDALEAELQRRGVL